MRAEIISIGTELLLGKVVNSNAAFISDKLTSFGIEVSGHTTVRNQSDDLKEAVKKAEKRAELIILIGGLGPSEDDITKQTMSSYLDTDLILHKETEEKILTYHKNSGFEIPENNQLQALIFAGSVPLINDRGLAVGMILEKSTHHYILLPGPPDECRPMVEKYLKEELICRLMNKQTVVSRLFRFFGLTEHQLSKKIDAVINKNGHAIITTHTCEEEVVVRVSIRADTEKEGNKCIDKIESQILNVLDGYFFGYGEKRLTDVVKDLLLERKLTITAAESLTGGAFMSSITSGVSTGLIFEGGVVTYSEDKKYKILDISQETIENSGVVSSECASEMAENVRKMFDADIGVGLTGVAGPGSLEGQIPGTVYIGVSYKGHNTLVKHFHFDYKRNRNRRLAVLNAQDMVRRLILETH